MKTRILALAAVLALSACSGAPATGEATAANNATSGPKVAVAFYPLEYAAQQVGGDRITITNLTVPGQEPHDLELTPQQIATLDDADLVVYVGGFQPAVDQAVAAAKTKHKLDLAQHIELHAMSEDGHDHDHDHGATPDDAHDHESKHADHDHGDIDPHFWLDPTKLAEAMTEISEHLSEIDAANASSYAANAEAATASMTALDQEFATGLSSCKTTTIITSHAAFGYLTDRYGLEQIGISGLSPNEQPSPARMAEVQEIAKEHKVTTIFFETLTSPDVARTLASELGLTTDVLDPLEGITSESAGTDYPSIMKANLEALKTANGCS